MDDDLRFFFWDHHKCLNCEFFFSDLIYVYYYGMLTIVVSFVSIPLVAEGCCFDSTLNFRWCRCFLGLHVHYAYFIPNSTINNTIDVNFMLKKLSKDNNYSSPMNYHEAFLRPKGKILMNSICRRCVSIFFYYPYHVHQCAYLSSSSIPSRS